MSCNVQELEEQSVEDDDENQHKKADWHVRSTHTIKRHCIAMPPRS